MEKNQIIIANGKNYKQMTIDILKAADLASEIGDRRTLVGVKPNLVAARSPQDGATTHPEVLSGILEYLQDNGFDNLVVLEGSWVGDRTMSAARVAGLTRVCEQYKVPFHDTQADRGVKVKVQGYDLEVVESALELGYLINVPVLKGHCQTSVTCALKNHKGLITNREKRRFHTQGLHKPIAYLGTYFKNEFIVVDNICGDLDFEEGGNPVVMNRVFCCKDPVLCDSYVCSIMGYELSDVPYIGMAERLGAGSSDLSKAEIINVNEAFVSGAPKSHGTVRRLAEHVEPVDACSACYGSLIYALKRLSDEGYLSRLPKDKICIGQGYKGKEGNIGVGQCTHCFAKTLKGCPPTATEMFDFLMDLCR